MTVQEASMAEDSPRIQARISGEVAGWLDGRADRMHAGSRHQQAAAELALWRTALNIELGRIRLTLGQANCLADVLNGHMIAPMIASRPGLVYAECYDAFQIARDIPLASDVSSYGAKHGPKGCDPAEWEQDLLGYLGRLNAVADHALADAIARWWDIQGIDFGSVGLEILEDV
jgi:hypothetical protein